MNEPATLEEQTTTADDSHFAVSTAVPPAEPMHSGRIDFFAPAVGEQFMLDDEQYLEIAHMSEGQRRDFLSKQSKTLKVGKDGSQEVPMNAGELRGWLIESAVIGWKVFRGEHEYNFTKQHLKEFITAMPIGTGKAIEDEIMRINPALSAEATEEDYEETIREAEEGLAKLREREGKDNT